MVAMPRGIATFLRSCMQTEFCLYKVDMKYIRNLHKKDDKVLSVSPQTGCTKNISQENLLLVRGVA